MRQHKPKVLAAVLENDGTGRFEPKVAQYGQRWGVSGKSVRHHSFETHHAEGLAEYQFDRCRGHPSATARFVYPIAQCAATVSDLIEANRPCHFAVLKDHPAHECRLLASSLANPHALAVLSEVLRCSPRLGRDDLLAITCVQSRKLSGIPLTPVTDGNVTKGFAD
jgi:hypothetical protein